MSTPGYYRNAIEDTYDWTASNPPGTYTLDATSVNSLYFPRETDIITVSGFSESIKCWAQWDTTANNWKIYISDMSFQGKVYYRLQASLIDRTA